MLGSKKSKMLKKLKIRSKCIVILCFILVSLLTGLWFTINEYLDARRCHTELYTFDSMIEERVKRLEGR